MSQYSLGFAKALADTARQAVDERRLNTVDEQQTVLYISLLATEIALKAILERAGRPVNEIRNRSHDLAALLQDVTQCYIDHPTIRRRVRATRLRAVSVVPGVERATVGRYIDAERRDGASRYPSGIRYDNGQLRHFPAPAIQRMASKVVDFAYEHWDDIGLI